jgi:hypothetical protein
MSCKSAIYTVNNTNITVTIGNDEYSQIPFGSVIRRFGNNVGLDGGSILCCNSGYFDVEASLTVTPTATGTVTAQIFQDGITVPGAFASATVADTDTTITLPIKALVRNCGCNCSSVLTIKINASCVVNNLATVVEKL